MAILVDYSQIVLGSIMQFQNDLKTGSDEKIVNLIRHVTLSSLLHNKRKFGDKYGDMIICADGSNYWRKEVFKNYKACRAKMRKKSDLNWKLIFDTISDMLNDLDENFPYKVIRVDVAEADDILGVLTKHFQENEFTEQGLFTEPQPVLLLTSDKDNLQLHRYSNVRQYSPMQKKFVKPELSADKSLIEKICTGDSGDGIPNIMSPDDVFVEEGKRQKPFRKARLANFYENGIDACENDTERRNFQRNELLVSYDKIPAELQEKILTKYNEAEIKGSKRKIMNYLIKHRCKNLMENIEDF